MGKKRKSHFLPLELKLFTSNSNKYILQLGQTNLVILTNLFRNLEKYRLMVLVMPHRSNPCEDSRTKRGKAISCHSGSSFCLLYFLKSPLRLSLVFLVPICSRPAPLRLMKKWGKEGQELIMTLKHPNS